MGGFDSLPLRLIYLYITIMVNFKNNGKLKLLIIVGTRLEIIRLRQ